MSTNYYNKMIRADKFIMDSWLIVKAYLRKGSCLLALREYGRAEAAYITALELQPDSTEAMEGFKRSCLYLTLKNNYYDLFNFIWHLALIVILWLTTQ